MKRRGYHFIILMLLLTLGASAFALYVSLGTSNKVMKVAATRSPEPPREDPPAVSSATPTPGAQPPIPKIYNKTYSVARKLLIKEGWQPNKRSPMHGQDVDVQSGNAPIFWQRGYWELEACSGTGKANCLFEFIDPTGRLLEVVTEGEEDEAGKYHARVSRVYLKKK